jgi:hypothetical protein
MRPLQTLAFFTLAAAAIAPPADSQSAQWEKLTVSKESTASAPVPLIVLDGVAYAIPSSCIPDTSHKSEEGQRQIGSASADKSATAANVNQQPSGTDSGASRQLGSTAASSRQLASDDDGARQLGASSGTARQLGSGEASRQLGSAAAARQLGSAAAEYLCRSSPTANFSEISGVPPGATLTAYFRGAALRLDRQGNTIRLFF